MKIGKKLGFKIGRIVLKSEERGEDLGFYFSDFSCHAAAWFGHAAACYENMGFEKARHAAAQGDHAAACCSQVFVWELSMPRHDSVFCLFLLFHLCTSPICI